ncbi:hypothetical protein VPZ60_004220 [Salmonella enterica]|nr:hypothetical protein [Salmonella enterica]
MNHDELTWRASEFQMLELAHRLLQWAGIPELRARMVNTNAGALRRTGVAGLARAIVAHDRLAIRLSVTVYGE